MGVGLTLHGRGREADLEVGAGGLTNGKGAGPIKPLDGAAVVLDADKAKQIAVLLHGQNNGAMPAWKQLSDTDLAAVITFTKNNWSNKTGQLVQPADVKSARQ